METTLPHNWQPRPYQMPLWLALEGGYKRAVAVWHRRAGKDSVGLNWTVIAAHQRVGMYWHLFPTLKQGKRILWDGMTREGRGFLDYFPPEVVKARNSSEMKITLRNGSIWQIVGADYVADALVGANPVGCVFSEHALQDPRAWDLIRPILAENGGWALFLYTPRGRNHGYDLLRMAERNDDWFAEVLTVDDTHAIQPEAIEAERRASMPEELVAQEFYCSFEASLVGAYYGKQMAAALDGDRIASVPWEPKLPVHTWWDLGIGDSTAIWFVQLAGLEVRLIDYYETSGEGLSHYAKVLQERDYVYGEHIAPHDIEVRELGTGKSRKETAAGLGIRFGVAPKLPVDEGIDAVRALIPRCWFDEQKCERGIEALRQYRKGWDDRLKVFRDRPLHDWASHAADAFRYGALTLDEIKPKRRRPLPEQAEMDYRMFG